MRANERGGEERERGRERVGERGGRREGGRRGRRTEGKRGGRKEGKIVGDETGGEGIPTGDCYTYMPMVCR